MSSSLFCGWLLTISALNQTDAVNLSYFASLDSWDKILSVLNNLEELLMKAGPRSLASPGTQHLLGSVILMASQDGFHQAVSKTALYSYLPFQFFFSFYSCDRWVSEANSLSSAPQGEELRCSWGLVLRAMVTIMEVLISHLQITRKGVIYQLTLMGCFQSWTRDSWSSHCSARLLWSSGSRHRDFCWFSQQPTLPIEQENPSFIFFFNIETLCYLFF